MDNNVDICIPEFILRQFFQIYLGVDPQDIEKIAQLEQKYKDWVLEDWKNRLVTYYRYSWPDLYKDMLDYKGYTNGDYEVSRKLVRLVLDHFDVEDAQDALDYARSFMETSQDALWEKYIEDGLSNSYLLASYVEEYAEEED